MKWNDTLERAGPGWKWWWKAWWLALSTLCSIICFGDFWVFFVWWYGKLCKWKNPQSFNLSVKKSNPVSRLRRPEILKSRLAHVHLALCAVHLHTQACEKCLFPNWNSWHQFYGNYWKLVEGDSCRFYPGPSVEWKLTITTRITASMVCWSARTRKEACRPGGTARPLPRLAKLESWQLFYLGSRGRKVLLQRWMAEM